jgi:hypothetical protein
MLPEGSATAHRSPFFEPSINNRTSERPNPLLSRGAARRFGSASVGVSGRAKSPAMVGRSSACQRPLAGAFFLRFSGRDSATNPAVSNPTDWSRFWSWDLSSSPDPRISPEKYAPTERYRSTRGKCSRGRNGRFCARGWVSASPRPGPDDASPALAVQCWPADPGWFADCQVAWVT